MSVKLVLCAASVAACARSVSLPASRRCATTGESYAAADCSLGDPTGAKGVSMALAAWANGLAADDGCVQGADAICWSSWAVR